MRTTRIHSPFSILGSILSKPFINSQFNYSYSISFALPRTKPKMGDAIPTSPSTKQINLLRGWPHASLLPVGKIREASKRALGDEKTVIPGLCYGPDAGFQPLRESIQEWTGRFFNGDRKTEEGMSESKETRGRDGEKLGDRICITGGASQNLACVLQVYSDPVYTNVWMVAPCYFLACRIFEDSGGEFSSFLFEMFSMFVSKWCGCQDRVRAGDRLLNWMWSYATIMVWVGHKATSYQMAVTLQKASLDV
jgi:hypothetical protein